MPKSRSKSKSVHDGVIRAPHHRARLLYEVVAFLERRRLDVPRVLRASCPDPPPPPAPYTSGDPSKSAEVQWAMTLLEGLKEREKRALERFLKKRQSNTADDDGDGLSAPASTVSHQGPGAVVTAPCSDGEDDDGTPGAPAESPAVRGGKWPSDVKYTNDYVWRDDVGAAMLKLYRPVAPRQRAARPCARTFGAVVTEADHPAQGEHGLFAAVPLLSLIHI